MSMFHFFLSKSGITLGLCLALLVMMSSEGHSQCIASPFDVDEEGWSITPGGGTLTWVADGGNPSGHLTMEDLVSGALTAFAPSSFTGDLQSFDGGTLSVDLIEITTASGSQRDSFGSVTIVGTAGSASRDIVAGAPTTSWATYSVGFEASEWGVSQDTWEAILSDVTEISMDVDSYNNFNDTIGFDNFRILIAASWQNYGQGFPGTLGVPSLTSSANPQLGAGITIDIGNSFGASTTGAVFAGFSPASTPGAWGGELLLIPALVIPISIPGAGLSLPIIIPNEPTLCGVSVFAQVLELDSGAALGISNTAGLELVLNY